MYPKNSYKTKKKKKKEKKNTRNETLTIGRRNLQYESRVPETRFETLSNSIVRRTRGFVLVRLRLTRKLPSRLDSSGEITLKYFPRWCSIRGKRDAKEETLTTTTRIKFITLGEEYIFGAWLWRILSPSVHNSASIKVGQWDFPSTSAPSIKDRGAEWWKNGTKNGGCKSLLLLLLLRFRSSGIAKLTNQFT